MRPRKVAVNAASKAVIEGYRLRTVNWFRGEGWGKANTSGRAQAARLPGPAPETSPLIPSTAPATCLPAA